MHEPTSPRSEERAFASVSAPGRPRVLGLTNADAGVAAQSLPGPFGLQILEDGPLEEEIILGLLGLQVLENKILEDAIVREKFAPRLRATALVTTEARPTGNRARLGAGGSSDPA